MYIDREDYLWELAGFYIGDGSRETNGNIYISSKYPELLHHYMILTIKIHSGSLVRIRKYIKRNKQWSPEYRLYIYNSPVTIFLKQIYYQRLMPDKLSWFYNEVINDRNALKNFIKGLFDSEGGIFWKQGHGREVKITTSSTTLKSIVELALIHYRIRYTIYTDSRRDAKHKKTTYNLRVFGSNSEKFIQVFKPYKLRVKEYIDNHVDEKYRKRLKDLLNT